MNLGEDAMAAPSMSGYRRSFVRANWPWLALILAVVAVGWCFTCHRWSPADWATPPAYSSDAMAGLAGGKALSTGEIWPLLPKNPPSLGAPFVANWNDFPTVEEGILAWWMILVRLFGLFAGTNLVVLSAHLLAALSFYFVCWQLNYNRIFSAVGAILFGLSPYSFARGFDHLVLTYYWHIPLGLLVAWWCLSSQPLFAHRRRLLIAICVAVFHGVQNPYYTWLFCQFLGLAALYQFVRRKGWRLVVGPLVVALLAGITFLAMNLDTAYYRLKNGPPPSAPAVRNYEGLELYALKPVELLLPTIHSIRVVESWTRKVYFERAFVRGEFGPAYLGLVGIIGFAALLWSVLRVLSQDPPVKLPSHFWGLLVIFAYSVVGGFNGIVGLFGIVLFRCSNRFSIAILAIVLLFLTRQLTSLSRRWSSTAAVAFAFVMVAIGIFDQLPPHQRAGGLSALQTRVASDAAFVAKLEAALPPGAKIFELPLMDFPEVGPLLEMSDYEEFRPYLYSQHLKYSYGSDKGRYRERWQRDVQQLGTKEMVRSLETYGFAAVLINRKGYGDRAMSLIKDLAKTDRSDVVAESSDLIAIELAPSPHPLMPPEFGPGWSGLEAGASGNWRWAEGNVSIVLHHAEAASRTVRIQFGLSALKSRRVTVTASSGPIYEQSVIGGADPVPVRLVVPLSPGKNELRFSSDKEAESPGNGDVRKLAYAVHDFQVSGL
jgi:hypothetical protein